MRIAQIRHINGMPSISVAKKGISAIAMPGRYESLFVSPFRIDECNRKPQGTTVACAPIPTVDFSSAHKRVQAGLQSLWQTSVEPYPNLRFRRGIRQQQAVFPNHYRFRRHAQPGDVFGHRVLVGVQVGNHYGDPVAPFVQIHPRHQFVEVSGHRVKPTLELSDGVIGGGDRGSAEIPVPQAVDIGQHPVGRCVGGIVAGEQHPQNTGNRLVDTHAAETRLHQSHAVEQIVVIARRVTRRWRILGQRRGGRKQSRRHQQGEYQRSKVNPAYPHDSRTRLCQ